MADEQNPKEDYGTIRLKRIHDRITEVETRVRQIFDETEAQIGIYEAQLKQKEKDLETANTTLETKRKEYEHNSQLQKNAFMDHLTDVEEKHRTVLETKDRQYKDNIVEVLGLKEEQYKDKNPNEMFQTLKENYSEQQKKYDELKKLQREQEQLLGLQLEKNDKLQNDYKTLLTEKQTLEVQLTAQNNNLNPIEDGVTSLEDTINHGEAKLKKGQQA